MYKADKGFGFILGEDGNDYFFHISQIKSMELPENYSKVDFTPSRNEKGLLANEIIVIKNLGSKFIVLGNERIKANNIKNYGISSTENYYQRIYEPIICEDNILDKVFAKLNAPSYYYIDTGEWYEISSKRYSAIAGGSQKYLYIVKLKRGHFLGDSSTNKVAEIDGIYDLNDHIHRFEDIESSYYKYKAGRDDVKKVIEEYLYITTYQGDNFKFYKSEASFDIYAKCNEIDEALA